MQANNEVISARIEKVKRDKAFYYNQGKRQYEVQGRTLFFIGQRGNNWRWEARKQGYKDAQLVWRGNNPDSDEWQMLKERNTRFCREAIRESTNRES